MTPSAITTATAADIHDLIELLGVLFFIEQDFFTRRLNSSDAVSPPC